MGGEGVSVSHLKTAQFRRHRVFICEVQTHPGDLLPFADIEVDDAVVVVVITAVTAAAGDITAPVTDQGLRPIIKGECETTKLSPLPAREICMHVGYLLPEQVEEEDGRFEASFPRRKTVSRLDVVLRGQTVTDPAGPVFRVVVDWG